MKSGEKRRTRRRRTGHNTRLGGGMRYRRSHKVFPHAVLITAIAFDQIAIVTELRLIDDAVTTPGKCAIQTAGSIRPTGILQAGIALFTQINHAVPAELENEMTVCSTTIGKGGIVDRRFAVLSERTLNDPVPTRTPFKKTARRTAIEITTIAIVTLLTGIKNGIATERVRTKDHYRLQTTTTIAAVTIHGISVVTLFRRFHNAVATRVAARNLNGLFPLTARRTAIFTETISIVTFLLRRFDDVVAAILQILPLAERGTIITVDPVTIVAFFIHIEKTITTTGGNRSEGNAGTIVTETGDALIVGCAGKARAVLTDLTLIAIVIG